MEVLTKRQPAALPQRRTGRPGQSVHGWVTRVNAAEDNRRSENSISTLDSLLGSTSDAEPQSPASSSGQVEWWRVRPRQAAPPRTTSISSATSPAGRFIANEEMLRNEVRAGRQTLEGQALELPKVTPYVSYGIALVHAAVYGTAVRVAAAQGSEAAAELLSGLGLSRGGVLEQDEAWRLLTSCFVQPELAPLAVVLYGLLAVAPRVEASLGYRTFVAAYLLSGLVAADVAVALGGSGGDGDLALAPASAAAAGGAGLLDAVLHPAAAAAAGPGLCGLGGLGAAMGMAGCALAHQLINGRVEQQGASASSPSSPSDASTSDASTSSSPSSSSSSRSSGISGSNSTSVGVGGGVSALGSGGGGVGGAAGWVGPAVLAAGCVAAAAAAAQGSGGGGDLGAATAALGAGFGTGFLLAATAGPRYQVTRQAELPDGSMWIPDPDSVQEVTVVLDQTTSIQRSLATGAVSGLAGLATLLLLVLSPR